MDFELEQRNIVFGYIRLNYDSEYPDDIINIIYAFYLIRIASGILDLKEQSALINLLYNRLKKDKEYENIKSIETELLFRASENEYDGDKFHTACDNKGPVLLIVETEYDHVFGAFLSKSWNGRIAAKDENAFLYIIRPTMEIFEQKKEPKKVRSRVVWGYHGYGPIIGNGADIWIYNQCHLKKNQRESGCQNKTRTTFDFNPMVLSGAQESNEYDNYCEFVVREYEIFHLDIK